MFSQIDFPGVVSSHIKKKKISFNVMNNKVIKYTSTIKVTYPGKL